MRAAPPVVLITGISSGIGLACAERFAEEGFAVWGVDATVSEEASERAEHSGGAVLVRDVRDGAGAFEAVSGLLERAGRLDALVTCAGVAREAAISRLTEETWSEVVDVDLKGTFHYLAAAAPVFMEHRSGKIVTVASTLALRARRGLSAYVAAKAGVIGLTRACARDLGRYNVNANCVVPGLVLTPLGMTVPPAQREKLQEETCLGRLAEPMDVADVIHFLCTERARHVTGEAVRVDGGQLA